MYGGVGDYGFEGTFGRVQNEVVYFDVGQVIRR